MKTITEAKEGVSKKLTDQNRCLTLKDVQDSLDSLRGAIMIVYPMKLPAYDPVQEELDNKEDLSGTQVSGGLITAHIVTIFVTLLELIWMFLSPTWWYLDWIDDSFENLNSRQAALEVIEKGTLWWAGKELMSDKSLEDYIGKNEKTKIVVKLAKVNTLNIP